MSVVKVKATQPGEADVFIDGEFVGWVRRFTTRYNLRRTITVTSWRWYTRTPEGRPIPEKGAFSRREYGTRRDAVAALVEALS